MEEVYLDNAATTPIAPEVLEAMLPYMHEHFGNPSSTHSFGRTAKNAIEKARKQIAGYLNAEPSEIIFTSGGTEADNMALYCAVKDLGVTRIITSTIEHLAVCNTVELLKESFSCSVDYVDVLPNGSIDLVHLEQLLRKEPTTIVSLMHGNNEIGNLLPMHEVSRLCRANGAYFHSDTVQTIGHYRFDVKDLDIDFMACSGHKFHGPKGIGFLYAANKNKIKKLISGGSQERNHRGGTENIYGIIGLAKAMEMAYADLAEHQQHIQGIKDYMLDGLKQIEPRIQINGASQSEESLYTVLNVGFPEKENNGMLLFSLDINGVAASGGSACSSGSSKGSHVLFSLDGLEDYISIRFSFSKYTNKEEIDFALAKIKECFKA